MTKKEKLFISILLEMSGDMFSNKACEDIPNNILNLLTDEEKDKLMKEYHEWNGDPYEYAPGYFMKQCSPWCHFFADKLSRNNDDEEEKNIS